MASKAVYYNLYDYDKLNGRYRAAELMVMLGIRHRQQIAHYSTCGAIYRKRYLFERVDDEPIGILLAEEWDRERKQLLKRLM